MTLLENKTSSLVFTLIEKTKQNKVVWEKTLSSDHYRAQFTNNQIVIRRGLDRLDCSGNFYSLSIRDDDGRLVEVIRQSPGEKDHYRLEQMFNAARESAEHYIEENLDNLLQELQSI